MDCIICDSVFHACFFFDLVCHFVNFTASTQLRLRAENVVSETLSEFRRQRNLRKYVTDSEKVFGVQTFSCRVLLLGLPGKPSFVPRTKEFPLGSECGRGLAAFKSSG